MSRVVLIVLIVATLAAYAPVRRAGFVYEDPVYLSFATRALTLPEIVQPRGLTMLSFRLNGLWDGLEPHSYHAVNVGLHLLVGLAFFGFARTLLPVPYALVAAGLALLHPIQTEAVAYVAGRAELIAALGAILALWAVAGPLTWTAAGLAFLGTVLAIGGKEMGLMALLLIACYAVVIRRVPLLAWRTVGWASLVALSLAALALPILQIRVIGAIEYLQMTEASPFRYACTQAFALWVWLSNIVWPSRLTVDYDFDFLTRTVGVISAAGLVACVVAAWCLRHRAPVVAFGVLWIVIALLPRFVVPISEQLNLHQTYTAFLGAWLALAAGLMHLNAYLTTSKEPICVEPSPSLS